MNYELEDYKNWLLWLSDWLNDTASEITEKDISILDYFLPTINFSVSKMNYQITRIKNKDNQ